ncbi:hypothetical protein [Caulobacter sp. UNC358MFTsu5.1]|uniref:hypothetical protein n=1 Tax=Caulobacter sp. UNC358MFTsu5.1 TaxID=1449049 RepID=UPI0012DD9485|nr:hypothetical protein [Caulobacter sp. UNC358MFTsu5.1]
MTDRSSDPVGLAPISKFLAGVTPSIPAFTAGAVVCSLVYTLGYFHFSGIYWISSFTLLDLFSRTWSVLPSYTLSLILTGLTYPYLMKISERLRRNRTSPTDEAPEKRSLLWNLIAALCAVLSFSSAIFLLYALKSTNPYEYSVRIYYIAYFIHAVFLINFFGLTISSMRLILVPLICYVIISITFIDGLMSGIRAITEEGNALVVYGDHRYCGKYLMNSERGILLYDPIHKSVKFIRQDQIHTVERPVQCSLPKEWQPKTSNSNAAKVNAAKDKGVQAH